MLVGREVKLGALEVAVGDIVALPAEEDAEEGRLQFALLQALWQTASKAKMMQVMCMHASSELLCGVTLQLYVRSLAVSVLFCSRPETQLIER